MNLLKKARLGLSLLVLLTLPVLIVFRAWATIPPAMLAQSGDLCGPLSAPTGDVVNVATVSELQDAVDNLASDTTILIADGAYDLTNTLVIGGGVDNVALRGASGDRDAVIIRGQGMSNSNYGNVPHGVMIRDATNVLIADLTIQDAYYHDIQIQGEQGAQAVRLYNLHLLDAGEQLVKGSTAGPPGPYADDGIVECSLIEYTDRARSGYTNGVDVLAGANWIIRDNIFRRIRAPVGELAGPTVLFWRNSLNTVVERNLFVDCDRGIALGLSAPDGYSRDGETTYDHQGGVIRNNFIYQTAASPTADVGVTVNYARDYKIYHNTVILNDAFPWAIEYRFSVSDGEVAYNLTDGPIMQRDGAGGVLTGNVTNAQTGWFVDAAAGDLHLVDTAVNAIDQAGALAGVTDDYDGDARPIGAAPDVGADEYGAPPPTAVNDLRVTQAITSATTLTATLHWTAPTGAITTTLRTAAAPITDAAWTSATLLTGALSGTAETYTATIPYNGNTAYFALKTQSTAGDWSDLSNNAFWPYWHVFLPYVTAD